MARGVVAVIQVLAARVRLGQKLAGIVVGIEVLGAANVGVRHQTAEVVLGPGRRTAVAVGLEVLVAARVVGGAQFRGHSGFAHACDVAAQVIAEVSGVARA